MGKDKKEYVEGAIKSPKIESKEELDRKIIYSEPEEYIPKEIRKKYKVGEFAQEDVTNKKCYIHESGCDTHLDYLELDKRDACVLDGPSRKEYYITLINEHKRKFEIIITAKEYKELSEINPEEYLPRAAEIINSKKPEINKPIVQLIFK